MNHRPNHRYTCRTIRKEVKNRKIIRIVITRQCNSVAISCIVNCEITAADNSRISSRSAPTKGKLFNRQKNFSSPQVFAYVRISENTTICINIYVHYTQFAINSVYKDHFYHFAASNTTILCNTRNGHTTISSFKINN